MRGRKQSREDIPASPTAATEAIIDLPASRRKNEMNCMKVVEGMKRCKIQRHLLH